MNPADLIDGRYRLERLVGTGGMAEVWLAEDTRLGRWVAVKVLLPLTGDDLGTSLADEARVIARLQHPNIVAAYDAGETNGRHFVVLEYVNGYTARQLLESQGPFGEAEVVRLGSQLASALQYAHQQDILHSDIKPENILLTETRVAKLADFGTAEAVSRTLTAEQAREILGTIAYLAPEVLQGGNASPASDVYSLGLTLYELLLGRLPFAGASPAAIAAQRLSSPAPPLRSLVPNASPQMEALIARAVAIRPAERFQSAGQLGGALRGVPAQTAGQLTSRVRTVVPPPPLVVTRQPQRRAATGRVAAGLPPPGGPNAGLLSGAIAVVALGLGAAAIGAYIYLSSSDDNPDTEPTPAPSPTGAASPLPTASPTRTTVATATPSPTKEPSPSPSPSPSVTTAATSVPPSQTPPPARTPTPTPPAGPSATATATAKATLPPNITPSPTP